MDYRVSYQGHSMVVSIGHAHEPIRVNGEATIYSVSDGRANVDQCIRLAMRALWACQIVECEEDATSTDCVVWAEVEYEPIRSARRSVPADLRAAYAWTQAAGELDDLRDLDDEDARVYAEESAANAAEHAEPDVTACDLLDLRDWLLEVRA